VIERAILRLLIALARLALEHDRGVRDQQKTRDAVTDAIAAGERELLDADPKVSTEWRG
jgi:hypothetical protein